MGPGELRYGIAALEFYGSWRAAPSGLFVAHVFAVGGKEAGARTITLPSWLKPTRCRWNGDGFVLISDSGDVVATLRPTARSLDFPRQHSTKPAHSWSALQPATGHRLVGRWEPIEDRHRPPLFPFLSILRDDTWSGSDGCNTTNGRWAADDEGWVVAAAGPTTLAFCWGVPVPSWWAQSARAGFDGDELVLLDDGGVTLGHLRRTDGPDSLP